MDRKFRIETTMERMVRIEETDPLVKEVVIKDGDRVNDSKRYYIKIHK